MRIRNLIDANDLETVREGKIMYNLKPSIIKYTAKDDFGIDCRDEKTCGGDWDLEALLFNDTSIAYLSFRQVFFENKKWEDTVLYNGNYQAGTGRIKCVDKNETLWIKNARCKYLEYLFKSIKYFGYVQDPYENHISVLIGRDGRIIVNNGRHRLAIAKLLNLRYVPILVDIVHSDLIKLKCDIIKYARHHDNKVYAPLMHFYLSDIPVRQIGRYEDILNNLDTDIKTVVDLGSNWGYMCKVLSLKGFKCLAVENDDIEYSFLQRLKFDYKFDTVKSDICDLINKKPKWDCVLALSIFHHLIKTEYGYKRLIQLLNKLDCKQMIFQMPCAEEMKLFDCYRDYSPAEFVCFIIDNSCLNKCEEIGSRDNRKMYVLKT